MAKHRTRIRKKTASSKPVYSKKKFGIQNGLIFILLFLLSTQLGKHFFFDFSYISAVRIDYLAPTLYLTDVLSVFLIVLNFKKILPVVKHKFFIIALLFFVLNIIFAASPPLALYKFVKILEIFLLFIVFRSTIPSPKIFLSAFLSGAILQLILAVLQLIYKHSIQGPFYLLGERLFNLSTPGIAKASYQGIEILRPYGTFSHPNSMAGFYLLVHTFVLTYPPFKKMPILKYSLLAVSAALILISFSKVAIVGFFIVTFFYTLTHGDEINCVFCIIARIIVAGILAVIFSLVQGDPLSGQQRVQLAQNSLEIIKNHLLLGTGIGNYLLSQSQFSMKTPYFFLQPVHNIFLLSLAELGVVFCGYLGYLIWKVRNIFVDNPNLIYCCGVIVFTGMFDHYWLTLQQNFLLAPILLAFAASRSIRRGDALRTI